MAGFEEARQEFTRELYLGLKIQCILLLFVERYKVYTWILTLCRLQYPNGWSSCLSQGL